MKLKCGGVEGGWMQVVDVDMTKDDAQEVVFGYNPAQYGRSQLRTYH